MKKKVFRKTFNKRLSNISTGNKNMKTSKFASKSTDVFQEYQKLEE